MDTSAIRAMINELTEAEAKRALRVIAELASEGKACTLETLTHLMHSVK